MRLLWSVGTFFILPVLCWISGHRWHQWSHHAATIDYRVCERCGAFSE